MGIRPGRSNRGFFLKALKEAPEAFSFLGVVKTAPIKDGQEPVLEVLFPVEAAESPENLEECLLTDILGILAVAKDICGHGHCQRFVHLDNPPETLPVALETAVDNFLFFHQFLLGLYFIPIGMSSPDTATEDTVGPATQNHSIVYFARGGKIV